MQDHACVTKVVVMLTSHDPKSGKQLSIRVSGYGRYDCVIGPLVGGQTIGMVRIQDEVVPSILKSEATAIWHYPCKERIL